MAKQRQSVHPSLIKETEALKRAVEPRRKEGRKEGSKNSARQLKCTEH
jgi:hypothetical protein